MAKICPVCDERFGFYAKKTQIKSDDDASIIEIHEHCNDEFEKALEREKKDIKDFKESATESRTIERNQEQEHIIEKNTVQVTNFDMPLGNMVSFMVKWAIASIPAFIILFIIFAIFFVIFGTLFF